MRLTYIHIQNFKSIRDMEIRDIDRALTLVGKNNTGKTSVLDAVCAALGLLQLAMTAVALIVGVVCATYSPLCIAAPVWGVWAKRAAGKPAARAKAA